MSTVDFVLTPIAPKQFGEATGLDRRNNFRAFYCANWHESFLLPRPEKCEPIKKKNCQSDSIGSVCLNYLHPCKRQLNLSDGNFVCSFVLKNFSTSKNT